jgi:hypothetical protein
VQMVQRREKRKQPREGGWYNGRDEWYNWGENGTTWERDGTTEREMVQRRERWYKGRGWYNRRENGTTGKSMVQGGERWYNGGEMVQRGKRWYNGREMVQRGMRTVQRGREWYNSREMVALVQRDERMVLRRWTDGTNGQHCSSQSWRRSVTSLLSLQYLSSEKKQKAIARNRELDNAAKVARSECECDDEHGRVPVTLETVDLFEWDHLVQSFDDPVYRTVSALVGGGVSAERCDEERAKCRLLYIECHQAHSAKQTSERAAWRRAQQG